MLETILESMERREKEERRQKINESRYNSYYKMIITEKISKYLEGRRKKKDRRLVVRYRCGNEISGSKHWREKEDRKCRICGEVEENLFYVLFYIKYYYILKECEITKNEIPIEEFIGEGGKGLESMKRIERARDKMKEKKMEEEEGEELE